jgi:NADPH2:quinone reductase
MTINGKGSHGDYELLEVPRPEPAPGKLLIRVRATALNRADLAQRERRYAQPALAAGGPPIAGLEAAGEVVGLGAGARDWKIGDRAMAMCSGAFAEYVIVDARLALPVPERLDWSQAAATPVALLTEHDAIVTHGRLRQGESLALHGAGSGAGMMGVQIARLLGAAPVFATVSTPGRAAFVADLGADFVLCGAERFADAVAEHTADGVDVVIDHVGAPLLAASVEALAPFGRLVSVGRLGGRRAEIDLDRLAAKNLTLSGASFRTRSLARWAEVTERAARLLPALADGRLSPVVDAVFPLTDIGRAQERMVANAHQGKIVLSVGGDR